MRHSILTSVIFASAIMFSACEKNPSDAGTPKAAKINIELKNYHNEAGALSQKTWEKSDKTSIFSIASDSPAVSTGVPISTGGQTALFTFSVTDVSNGDVLMAYLPSTADLECSKGGLKAEIPVMQDGTINPVFVGTTKFTDAHSGSSMRMMPYWTTVYANVQMGAYSVKSATMRANGGEKLGGEVFINGSDLSVAATAETVTVEFEQARDCRLGGISFPILVAPGTFSQGFTITFTTETGETFDYCNTESVTLEMGERFNTDNANSASTQILVCGDNMIYLLDAELALSAGYKNAIVWKWDAKDYYQTVGLSQNNMIRLDDCKPVDDKKKILATSSKGYSVLIDRETGDVLWHSNSSQNAHSAELLPNNRIAVACSDGGDAVQIFDIGAPNAVRFWTSLPHAHGVVWNPASERLYAIGNTTFNIYQLTDWNTSAPKLTLERSISTNSHVTGLHDLMLIDENTLLLAGNKAVFYNITQDTFTQIPIFAKSHSLKSVNYNKDTGECWFTDPSVVEVPELTWASRTIRYTDDINQKYETRNFRIDDLNVYKVRVLNW